MFAVFRNYDKTVARIVELKVDDSELNNILKKERLYSSKGYKDIEFFDGEIEYLNDSNNS